MLACFLALPKLPGISGFLLALPELLGTLGFALGFSRAPWNSWPPLWFFLNTMKLLAFPLALPKLPGTCKVLEWPLKGLRMALERSQNGP